MLSSFGSISFSAFRCANALKDRSDSIIVHLGGIYATIKGFAGIGNQNDLIPEFVVDNIVFVGMTVAFGYFEILIVAQGF